MPSIVLRVASYVAVLLVGLLAGGLLILAGPKTLRTRIARVLSGAAAAVGVPK